MGHTQGGSPLRIRHLPWLITMLIASITPVSSNELDVDKIIQLKKAGFSAEEIRTILESQTDRVGTAEPQTSLDETQGSISIPEIVESLSDSVVTLTAGDSTGTAFCYGRPDVLVTNYHVIKDGTLVRGKTRSGREFTVSEILREDPERDLAVLKVRLGRFRPIPRAQTARVGEQVVTIGSSLGTFEFSVSDGVISAFRGGAAAYDRAVQISAPISPGNSGGPLLNLKGEVIGVNTFSARRGQNLNFSVPIDYVDRVLNPDRISLAIGVDADSSSTSTPGKLRRRKDFPKLLRVCREYLPKMVSPATMKDALMLVRALDDVHGESAEVKANLAKLYSYSGREEEARKALRNAKLHQLESDPNGLQAVIEAEITVEVAFGDDRKAKNLLKQLRPPKKSKAKRSAWRTRKMGPNSSNENSDGQTFYERMKKHGHRGHIERPIARAKLQRLKGRPKAEYSFNLFNQKVDVWLYLRRNQWTDDVRVLVLYLADDVYWGQGNTLNYLPRESEMHNILSKDFNELRDRSEIAWKNLEADQSFKDLLPSFPEFSGLGWRILSGFR